MSAPDVLVERHSTGYGAFVLYRGTIAELVAGTPATAGWFENLGKTGVKTAYTEFGDQYRVQRLRGGGTFDLALSLFREVPDPWEKRSLKLKWRREFAPIAERVVAEALSRLRCPN